MEKVIKNYSVKTKAIDTEAGIYEAVITTESPDRMGDIVRADGARIENFLKNPVVLWAHDYGEPPVAKAVGLEIVPQTGIRATFQFPEWGAYEKADTVRKLWAGGYLNATSIGFMPMKSVNLGEDARGPKDFTEWELLEFSIVPVPANAEALRLAIKSLESGGCPPSLSTLEGASSQGPLRSAHTQNTGTRADLGEGTQDLPIEQPVDTVESHNIDMEPSEDGSSLNDESEAELADELNKLLKILAPLGAKGKKL